MNQAKEIMDRVRDYLIESLHDNSSETKESIEETCDNVTSLLVLWDGVLSHLHIAFPTEEQCDQTQVFIDAAIKLANVMGMTKTVKGHGSQRHIVSQMRSVYGGLPEFDESWAERIHQWGYSADMKLRNFSECKKALIRATNFRRTSKPQTQDAINSLSTFERGPRKRTRVKQNEQEHVKKERRLSALKR